MDEDRFSRIETSLFIAVVIVTAVSSVFTVILFIRAFQVLSWLLRA